jgi:hypothetical protein
MQPFEETGRMVEKQKPVSLNQVIDLIHAGPETAAKMGQYPQIWERMPDLCAELETIAGKLDALGIDGWRLLRAQRRLKRVFNYYDCWKDIQANRPDAIGRDMCFTIAGSKLLKQSRATALIMKQMIRKNRKIELALKDGVLWVTCANLAVSFPARHEDERTMMVEPSFVKVLLYALAKDEWIKCRLAEDAYEINGATYRPAAPA